MVHDEEPVRPIAGRGRNGNRPQAAPANDRRFVPLHEREALMNELQDLRRGRNGNGNENSIEVLFSNNATEE